MWIAGTVVVISVLAWVLLMVLFSVTSTKPRDLGPTEENRLRPCPGTPNCVCSSDEGAFAIEPLTFGDTPEEAWKRLMQVVGSQPRASLITQTPGYLHYEFHSLIFRFVDDVEFLLDAENKRIQVRSASRAGRSDLGVNRARVEAIRAQFNR